MILLPHKRNFATNKDPIINAMPIFQSTNKYTTPIIIKNPVITLRSGFGPAGIMCNIEAIKNNTIDIFQLKKIKIIASTNSKDLIKLRIFIDLFILKGKEYFA